MMGDQTLFQRADTIEAGWEVVQPIVDAWRNGAGGRPELYPAGSAGPEAAAALLARDRRQWREIW
jgi:glucose-6-phosphate 1-dehydrogenase